MHGLVLTALGDILLSDLRQPLQRPSHLWICSSCVKLCEAHRAALTQRVFCGQRTDRRLRCLCGTDPKGPTCRLTLEVLEPLESLLPVPVPTSVHSGPQLARVAHDAGAAASAAAAAAEGAPAPPPAAAEPPVTGTRRQ